MSNNFTVSIYLNTRTFQDSDKEYTIFLYGGDIPVLRFEELFLVAKLHLNDVPEDVESQYFLHVVYSITQNRYTENTEELWSEYPEIEMLVSKSQRSTAIGDVFEWNGHFWMVAPFGFVEIYPQK